MVIMKNNVFFRSLLVSLCRKTWSSHARFFTASLLLITIAFLWWYLSLTNAYFDQNAAKNTTKTYFDLNAAKMTASDSALPVTMSGSKSSLPLHPLPPEGNARVAGDGGPSDDRHYMEVLNIFQDRLKRFTGDRTNLSAFTCHQLKRKETARPCYDRKCPGTFSASPKERLDQVLATRAQLPPKVSQALQSSVENISRHQYLFVSGASSHYYPVAQALLENVFRTIFPQMAGKDFLLIIFDLGLKKEQRRMMEKNCRCTMLDFPFSQLPPFVKELKCYTWKPLIITSLVDKAEYLVWMDTSIRWFNGAPMDVVFQRAKERGFQVKTNQGSIAVRTNPTMTNYFGDHLCQYAAFDEFEANLGVFYIDRFTKDAIISPWVSCALNRTCMCMPGHGRFLYCSSSPPRVYGRCHRFDQAALGIIFSKLLLDQRPMVIMPRGVAEVKRGHSASWFH